MRWLTPLTLVLALAGCGADERRGDDTSAVAAATSPAQTATAVERGGTMTVGGQSWTFVPSTQCSIYPGNVVSIAGHAAEDTSLEIVIDYGGPTGARIGDEGSAVGWRATQESLKIEIDGRHVRGTATFQKIGAGAAASAEGSFDITC